MSRRGTNEHDVEAGCVVAPVPSWRGVKTEKTVDAPGTAAAAPAANDAGRLKELMLGYQNADPDAANQLVVQLSPMLLRFLAGPLYTRAFAEDMLQDCWLRLHRARHSYRPGTPVLPWVFAIARHTRIDAYRRRLRIETRESTLDQVSDTDGRASTPAVTPEIDLWRFVRQLPASQQEVILMLKVSGMSLEEVARATGGTVGSVKQKAHRAYVKLRRLIDGRSVDSNTNESKTGGSEAKGAKR